MRISKFLNPSFPSVLVVARIKTSLPDWTARRYVDITLHELAVTTSLRDGLVRLLHCPSVMLFERAWKIASMLE